MDQAIETFRVTLVTGGGPSVARDYAPDDSSVDWIVVSRSKSAIALCCSRLRGAQQLAFSRKTLGVEGSRLHQL